MLFIFGLENLQNQPSSGFSVKVKSLLNSQMAPKGDVSLPHLLQVRKGSREERPSEQTARPGPLPASHPVLGLPHCTPPSSCAAQTHPAEAPAWFEGHPELNTSPEFQLPVQENKVHNFFFNFKLLEFQISIFICLLSNCSIVWKTEIFSPCLC